MPIFFLNPTKGIQDKNVFYDCLNFPLKELLITARPSRAPNEYVNNSRQAIAARQLANTGVTVEPGIKFTYLVKNATAKDPNERVKVAQLMTGDETYDLTEYQKLCTGPMNH